MLIAIENLVDTISVETVPELEIASNVTKMNQETTTDNAKQQKALYEKRLKDFLKSDQDTTMEFPSTLSSQVRKLIHEVSVQINCIRKQILSIIVIRGIRFVTCK